MDKAAGFRPNANGFINTDLTPPSLQLYCLKLFWVLWTWKRASDSVRIGVLFYVLCIFFFWETRHKDLMLRNYANGKLCGVLSFSCMS